MRDQYFEDKYLLKTLFTNSVYLLNMFSGPKILEETVFTDAVSPEIPQCHIAVSTSEHVEVLQFRN